MKLKTLPLLSTNLFQQKQFNSNQFNKTFKIFHQVNYELFTYENATPATFNTLVN